MSENDQNKVLKLFISNRPLVIVCIAFTIQYSLRAHLDNRVFVYMYPFVLLGALIGPMKSSIVSIFLSAILFSYFFLEPLGSLRVSSPSDIIGVVFFTVTNLFCVFIMDRQKKNSLKQSFQNLEQFQNLADSMPQLAWIARQDGYIFWYNRRWYEFTGTKPEQMEGWGWKSVHHAGHIAEVMEKWPFSIKSGEAFEMEFPLKAANGSFRWFLTRAVPIKDSQGTIIRWFGTNTDIDEYKKIREELERALKLRNEFITLASHEFKTPITSLKLQTQMFRRQLTLASGHGLNLERQIRYLDSHETQVDRLNLLVDELLDVSRIDLGKLMHDFKILNIPALVNDLLERFSDEFDANNCTVTFETEGELLIVGDKFRLEQMIMNLILNVFKYASHKPVTFSVFKRGQFAELRVQDHGTGIAEDNLVTIFNRFERAVPHNNISGLGLGLYIAKEIVNFHHGSIHAESEIGSGTTFIVRLPLIEDTNLLEK